jgi:hypothetical protein
MGIQQLGYQLAEPSTWNPGTMPRPPAAKPSSFSDLSSHDQQVAPTKDAEPNYPEQSKKALIQR